MDLRQFPRHISSAFENADQRLSHSPLYDGVSCKTVPLKETFSQCGFKIRQYLFFKKVQKSLTVENELVVQAGISCRESSKVDLIQNFILKMPVLRFSQKYTLRWASWGKKAILAFLQQKSNVFRFYVCRACTTYLSLNVVVKQQHIFTISTAKRCSKQKHLSLSVAVCGSLW